MFALNTGFVVASLAALCYGTAGVQAAPASCKVVSTAPLGYGVNTILGSRDLPKAYLTFQGHRTADGFQYLQPSKEPELFDFVACHDLINSNGEFSNEVKSGYIASRKASGYCLSATSLTGTDERIVSKPCHFIDNDLSNHQRFQFSVNSAGLYHFVDYLGKDQGPAPAGTGPDDFPIGNSGSGYHTSIVGDADSADSFLRLAYSPDAPKLGAAAAMAYYDGWTGKSIAQQ
ncbi:uncharacterized protein PFL1_02168 [Pseudozyma flocculosa PF-1]|uniref:Ricin B lectin domain-containing protein n=1 Tax=Pseudozyma flocculosa TaxID=84751 RepID=A0A5C3FDF5_9BASI|nr:uncharacterized protein PFL1_02168 [Pseudozyma flocculosa PF-1]EPQ30051.1 hypothetical protein PFL1_02168 [Pseudozyma flocculosa PF-1]SPO41389.1 uncharacterized protein PSFLO_06871 [Pseudozyma flocculosa]